MISERMDADKMLGAIVAAHMELREAKEGLERTRKVHNLSPQYIALQAAQRDKKLKQELLDGLMTETTRMVQPVIGAIFEEVAHQVNEGHVMDMPGVRVTAQVREG